MSKLTKDQKNRFAVAEKVITRDALASGLTLDDLISVADYVERGAVWRKPTKKKRRRGRELGRAYVSLQGTTLPRTEEELKDWKPLDYLTEDGLKEDPAFSVADVFRRDARPDLAVPTIAGATLEKLAEKVRDDDLAAEPVPTSVTNGIDLRGKVEAVDVDEAIRRMNRETAKRDRLTDLLLNGSGIFPVMPGTRHEDAEDAILEQGSASGCPECEAELERRAAAKKDVLDMKVREVRENLDSTEADEEFSRPVGEDPGDREVLTQWAEVIRQQDAAREAAREAAALEAEPEVGETNDSAGAKDWVLREGVRVGCPECTAEADRRRERDESLKRGRRKLAFRGQLQTGPLDDDELLAVAGSELYPAGDNEPSRELKIRNRKGEVRTWRSGGAQEGHGWTASPEDPWGLRYAWTSSEMDRRGPWHVI